VVRGRGARTHDFEQDKASRGEGALGQKSWLESVTILLYVFRANPASANHATLDQLLKPEQHSEYVHDRHVCHLRDFDGVLDHN
jgi:hypothetical protein